MSRTMLTASRAGSLWRDQHRARTVPYGPAVMAYTFPDSFRFQVAASKAMLHQYSIYTNATVHVCTTAHLAALPALHVQCI